MELVSLSIDSFPYVLLTYCYSLVAGHRRPHKGPREVTNNATTSPDHDKKPKKKSQVNARRDELMGERPPNEPAHVVQCSKDTRTQQEKDELHAWVCESIL